MKKTIKTLVLVMALVLALTAFTGCELFEKECTHEGTTELIPALFPHVPKQVCHWEQNAQSAAR